MRGRTESAPAALQEAEQSPTSWSKQHGNDAGTLQQGPGGRGRAAARLGRGQECQEEKLLFPVEIPVSVKKTKF